MENINIYKDYSKELDKFLEAGKLFEDITNLRVKYYESNDERLKIRDEMLNKLRNLSKILNDIELSKDVIRAELDRKESHVTDYERVLNILLDLANFYGGNYSMKIFNSKYGNFFKEILDRDEPGYYRYKKIYVIGKNDVLNSITNETIKNVLHFGDISRSIIEKGSSLVVFSDSFSDRHVFPSVWNSNSTEFISFDVYSNPNKIQCYLYDDELKKASLSFKDYISTYGSDLNNLNNYQLISNILTNKKERSI